MQYQICGIDGFNLAPDWGERDVVVGMGLSNNVGWTPIMSVANIRLGPGIHTVDLRVRNPRNNGEVRLHGVGMTIKIFHEID